MLKEAILEKGKAINQDVLLVDSFLNHQVDVKLMQQVGEAFAAYFKDRGITRVITIESSGIAPASFTALAMGLPLVIMKKQTSRIMTGDLLQTTVRSFTKGTSYELTIKREFLVPGEKVLFIDDFLASGEAAFGMLRLAKEAGIEVAGKTGTAQNPHGKDHSAFIGFAPYTNPKIAVCVYVENAGFGATYGVPIGSLIIEKYLNGEISPARKGIEERMLNSNTIVSSGVKKH